MALALSEVHSDAPLPHNSHLLLITELPSEHLVAIFFALHSRGKASPFLSQLAVQASLAKK